MLTSTITTAMGNHSTTETTKNYCYTANRSRRRTKDEKILAAAFMREADETKAKAILYALHILDKAHNKNAIRPPNPPYTP